MEGGDELQQALNMQPAGGGPDQNEQGGQPGKGQPKPPEGEDNDPNAVAALSILLEDVAHRIARNEIKMLEVPADKAAEDRDKYNEWASGAYVKHATYIEMTLTPICSAWAMQSGTAINPTVLADILSDMEPMLSSEDIPKMLDGWKRDNQRAKDLSALLHKEFIK